MKIENHPNNGWTLFNKFILSTNMTLALSHRAGFFLESEKGLKKKSACIRSSRNLISHIYLNINCESLIKYLHVHNS